MVNLTDDFLDMLANRGILPEKEVESFREQVTESSTPIHPVFVARRLVQAGYFNAYFAKTLLGELYASQQNGRPAGDELELEPLGDELPTGGGRWSDVPRNEPGAASGSQLDDLILPELGSHDLLAEPDAVEAPLLPSVRQRSGWAGLFGVRKLLRHYVSHTDFQRHLLIGCAVVALLAVATLIYVLLSL